MSENESSGQESSDERECPVDGCDYTNPSKQAVGSHFGQVHDEDVKRRVCLREIHRLADTLGKTPTGSDMDRQGLFSTRAYRTVFGSWNAALEAADLSLNHIPRIATEELLSELQRLATVMGRTPRKSDMAEDGAYEPTVYETRFGSWNNAIEAIGHEPNHIQGIPTEDLLNGFRRLAEKLGRVPGANDMDISGAYSSGVYENRFGSWNGIVELAGLKPNNVSDIPDEELLSEIRRVGDELGRPPRKRDMDKHGEYSSSACIRAFGTWRAALEAAGLEPHTHADWVLTGKDHPFWDGGTPSYGPGWNYAKKEQVRERDGRTCQNPGCGRTEEEHIEMCGKKHSVHHIQKARSFDDPEKRNHTNNLITLCETKECHRAWEKMSPLRPQI